MKTKFEYSSSEKFNRLLTPTDCPVHAVDDYDINTFQLEGESHTGLPRKVWSDGNKPRLQGEAAKVQNSIQTIGIHLSFPLSPKMYP